MAGVFGGFIDTVTGRPQGSTDEDWNRSDLGAGQRAPQQLAGQGWDWLGNRVGGNIGKEMQHHAGTINDSQTGWDAYMRTLSELPESVRIATGMGPKNYDEFNLVMPGGAADASKRFTGQRQANEAAAGNVDLTSGQGFAGNGIGNLYSMAQNPQLSQAQKMSQAQMAINANQQQAMLRSQHGGGVGASQRMAGQQLAQQNQEMIGQTQPLAAQEQIQAQTGAISGMTNQTVQQRQYEMQLQDLAKQYEMLGLDKYQAQLQAQLYAKGLQAQNSAAETALRNQVYGGLLSAGSGIAMQGFGSKQPQQPTQSQWQAAPMGTYDPSIVGA
jgi:hypothetical protein